MHDLLTDLVSASLPPTSRSRDPALARTQLPYAAVPRSRPPTPASWPRCGGVDRPAHKGDTVVFLAATVLSASTAGKTTGPDRRWQKAGARQRRAFLSDAWTSGSGRRRTADRRASSTPLFDKGVKTTVISTFRSRTCARHCPRCQGRRRRAYLRSRRNWQAFRRPRPAEARRSPAPDLLGARQDRDREVGRDGGRLRSRIGASGALIQALEELRRYAASYRARWRAKLEGNGIARSATRARCQQLRAGLRPLFFVARRAPAKLVKMMAASERSTSARYRPPRSDQAQARRTCSVLKQRSSSSHCR